MLEWVHTTLLQQGQQLQPVRGARPRSRRRTKTYSDVVNAESWREMGEELVD